MAKESQKHASVPWTKTDLSHNSNAQLGNLEKREIKEKPHRWIEARVRHLDPAGYMEEINSLHCFGRNAGCFALQIVAIANWGGNIWTWVSGFHTHVPPIPVHSRDEFTLGRSPGPRQAIPFAEHRRRCALKKQRGLEVDGGGVAILGR